MEPCQSFFGGSTDVSGICVKPLQKRLGNALETLGTIRFQVAANDSPGEVRVVGALARSPTKMAPSNDLAMDPVLLLYLFRSHELDRGTERVARSHAQQAANDRVAQRLSHQ